jgi:NDP-sugar pyrophosphorylase family protein
MLGYIRNWMRRDKGAYENIDIYVQFGKNVETGTWTEIRQGTIIGNNVVIGDWVKIGNNVIIEDNCIIPQHVRIMPNSRIKTGTVFEGHELVYGHGEYVPNCCSSSLMSEIEINGKDHIRINFIAGTFLVPEISFHHADKLMESYMWGINDDIMNYKMEKINDC